MYNYTLGQLKLILMFTLGRSKQTEGIAKHAKSYNFFNINLF